MRGQYARAATRSEEYALREEFGWLSRIRGNEDLRIEPGTGCFR
jgi:hypothetical protein